MTATYINTINNVCHKTHTRAHLREIEKKKNIRHDRRAIYISPNLRYIYEVDTHKTIN